MHELVAEAERLGFELRGNEADRTQAPPDLGRNMIGRPYTNWRERRQGRQPGRGFLSVPEDWKLMVWC
ncbi:MAG: hypothetical protein J2P57_09535 [Acidimicrobiaceae bacterium]|nr:hypothetical protein [Acidimicrobiaceae bacterium]